MTKTKPSQLKIFWVNKKKDSKILTCAINNSAAVIELAKVNFVRLKLDEKLFNSLVVMIQEQHLVAQNLFSEKGIYGELYPGSFRGGFTR